MVLYCIDDVDDDDQDRDRSIISFRPMYYSVVIVGRSQTSNNYTATSLTAIWMMPWSNSTTNSCDYYFVR